MRMKKELLRINDLNIRYSAANMLQNVSFTIMEGECVGFWGLTYSGKDYLIRLLSGSEDDPGIEGHFFFLGKPLNRWADLQEQIYHICAANYAIDSWTVAEYIDLVQSREARFLLRRRKLEEGVQDTFLELDYDIDVSLKMSQLTEIEKRLVDVAKAYRHGARVLIIEDEFDGMSEQEIITFSRILKRLALGRMGVIISSHSDLVMTILSDKYVIFNRGRIVKKCDKSFIRDAFHLEEYLLGISGEIEEEKRHSRRDAADPIMRSGSVYEVRNVPISDGRLEDLEFPKGKVITLLTLDRRRKERLFLILSGRKIGRNCLYLMDKKICPYTEYADFVRDRITSIRFLGSREEIFADMAVEENLLLPSLGKISEKDYLVFSSGIFKMLLDELRIGEMKMHMEAGRLEVNELIRMTLERWYIYNPQALILLDPFALCDAYGVSIVQSYIRKFASRGTAVIVLMTRNEYISEVADSIIDLDG